MSFVCSCQADKEIAGNAVVGDYKTDVGLKVLTDVDVAQGAERTELYVPLLADNRIAVVVNQTSFIGKTHLVDSLLSLGVNIVKIFAPEHGFRGEDDAGKIVENGKDLKTGLPIISLYGKMKKPTSEMLKGIDVVIFDIQDVGARFYTYLSTMHYVIESCFENDKTCIILDRPNPNGYYVDGPVLNSDYKSFVGMHTIPVVHGMTFGELAKMIVGEGWVGTGNLVVVECEGFNHNCTFDLPIKPSPNLPNLQSILLYPSLCFFEPTEYSIGRGTNMQFQVLGIPDSAAGKFTFIPQSMPGASSPKHKGVKCYGENLQKISIDDILKNKEIDLSYIIAHLGKENISKITSVSFFDKLAGSSELRTALEHGLSEQEIRNQWQPQLQQFNSIRQKYLLYD